MRRYRPVRRRSASIATRTLRDAVVLVALVALGTTVHVRVDAPGPGPIDARARERSLEEMRAPLAPADRETLVPALERVGPSRPPTDDPSATT